MYHDYASQSYYIKTRANQFIKEAEQARRISEYRLVRETKVVSKQKKAFFSSFGQISGAKTLFRHDI